ncbi:MAG: plastocyanin/azurin family copper-binding protein, partial [Dehalococcoidia bacterium]
AMLVGAADANVTPEILHLQMALAALGAERPDETVHHVRHFLDTAVGDLAHDGEAVLASLQGADTAAAADGLGTMVAAVLAVQAAAEHEDEREAADADSQAAGHEDEDDDHAEEQSSRPEALDPEDARTIAITMTEFAFGPNEVHVKRGEMVRLLLINEGGVLHDITAETFHGQAWALGSAEHEDSTVHAQEHAPVFHAAAVAGDTVELLFVATEVGEFDLFCSVPGHKELGMTATLIVEEA